MESPAPRGRPPEFSGDTLCHKRAELLNTFDYAWSRFAWQLQRAKTTRAVRKALQVIRHRPGLQPFVDEPHGDSSIDELRKTRKRLAGYERSLRRAADEQTIAKERLERVQGALLDMADDNRLELACRERGKELIRVSEVHADWQRICLGIEKEIQSREAAVAQTALLDYILSKRYTPTPISLANALAGVPFIVWRRSMALCIEACGDIPVSLSFQMFKDIQRALANPPRKAAEAIEQVREYLLLKKRPASHSIRTLRREWYYLSGSIEAVYSKQPTKGSLPYEVHAEYQRKTALRSRYDQVREEEERL